jgi:plastocyanin
MHRATLVFLIACSGGGSSSPPMVDAPPVPVVTLASCPATVAATVEDSPTKFVPDMSTIAVGQVVKFDITAEHFVIPSLNKPTDQALMIGRGETKCFRFDVPGVYIFVCGVHGFIGNITVQ